MNLYLFEWDGDELPQRKFLNQIIKCLNQIISENKPYNLGLCPFTKLNNKRKI